MGGDSYKPLHSTMSSSPIVEMPPSPAPSTLMHVEFPDDEVDKSQICDAHYIVEVSIFFTLSALAFCISYNRM